MNRAANFCIPYNRRISLFICVLFFATISLYGQEQVKTPDQYEKECQARIDSIVKNIGEKRSYLKTEYWKSIREITALNEEVQKINIKEAVTKSKEDANTLLKNQTRALKNIKDKFSLVSDEPGYSEIKTPELKDLEKQFVVAKNDVESVLEEWVSEINKPEPTTNWTPYLIVLGFGAVVAMFVMPMIKQKLADKKFDARMKKPVEEQGKQTKEAEWQILSAQYLQMWQNTENENAYERENLLSLFEGFIEKTPKELHKDEALTIINYLKSKKT